MRSFINMADFTELLKASAAFFTGIATLIAGVFGYLRWKKKAPASESKHAQSFKRDVETKDRVNALINTMLAAVPHAKVISTARWRNGKEPKEFRIETSTDFNTWTIWKNWNIPEDDLVKIQSATLEEGFCVFRPTQLQDDITREWYQGNNIEQTTSYLIGVNDLINESIVIYINYDKEHIVTPETRKLIRLYVNQLYEIYEPVGWLAKKNYLK